MSTRRPMDTPARRRGTGDVGQLEAGRRLCVYQPGVDSVRVQAGGGKWMLALLRPTFDDFDRRVASQGDRILEGNRPADVPYEQVTRFELVINPRTAKALDITLSVHAPHGAPPASARTTR